MHYRTELHTKMICQAPRITSIACVGLFVLVGCSEQARRYECMRTTHPITIDGRLNDAGWVDIPWTADFRDIEGDRKPDPPLRTRVKIAWDDEYLYVAANMEEPHVCGWLTAHDAIVYYDNDFEVFLDPDGDGENYYEVEVNALNTIFDLLLVRSYRNGGPARHDWDCQGLRSAVHVDGTLNDASDQDTGWSVELAFPWSTLAEYTDASVPPRPGDRWRLNMSRVEWRYKIENGEYVKSPADQSESNWTWTPQGVIDMHIPNRWGHLIFKE